MNGIYIGIACGLLSAFFQSIAYVFTRQYLQPRGGGSRQLLVIAHVFMGGVCLLTLPLMWPDAWPDWHQLILPLVLTTAFYLTGQLGLVIALRYAEPSRISPLLAFKLVVLALIVTFWAGTQLTQLQWLAVAFTVLGAIGLNTTGGVAHRNAILGVALACCAYALTDWNIAALVNALHDGGLPWWRSFLLTTMLVYISCGIIGAVLLTRYGSRRMRDWRDAAPFAGAWLTAMVFLYSAFGLLGVVYSNILLSTRGIMSVLMSTVLASWGLSHIEAKPTRKVFVLRMMAAFLMLGAVILYGWRKL